MCGSKAGLTFYILSVCTYWFNYWYLPTEYSYILFLLYTVLPDSLQFIIIVYIMILTKYYYLTSPTVDNILYINFFNSRTEIIEVYQ